MTVELLAKVTVILFVVACGTLVLRRASAASKHLVQVLGLAAVLLLPVLALALPAWELPLLSPAGTGFYPNANRSQSVPAPVIAPRSAPLAKPAPDEDDCPCESATAPLDLDRRELLTASVVRSGGSSALRGSAAGRLAWLWLLGAAAVLGRLGLGWWRTTRLAIDAEPLRCASTWRLVRACCERLGVRALPRVMTSDRLQIPALWGFVRPTLLLPAAALGWPADRLRVALLHELAHLRRRDGLSLLVGRLAAAAWWFHPLVWMIERRARRDCERACDDVVLACGERASTYAEHLLHIATGIPAARPLPSGALALVARGQLETRLRSILRDDTRRGLRRRLALALTFVIAGGLVGVSSARLVARAAGSEETITRTSRPEAIETERTDDALSTYTLQARDEADNPEILLAHDTGNHEGKAIFDRAYDAHRAEDFTAAIAAFEDAAAAGYRVATSLYNAGCGYARLGDVSAAIRSIEAAVDAGFDNGELLREDSDLDPIRRDPGFRGMLQRLEDEGRLRKVHGKDRYEASTSRYEELLDEGSTDGEAWYEVGSALLSLRDLDGAIDALERAVTHLAPRNHNALYNLACAHALDGNSGRSLDHLERSVLAGFDSKERFRNDSDLDALRSNRRFTEIEELHDTLSLDRFRQGGEWDSEYSPRRWAPAVEEFRAFVTQRPDVGRAWFDLGWALHHSRRHAEARDAFQRQFELGYRPGIATYNVACTFAMEDRVDDALTWLERAIDSSGISVYQAIGDDDLRALHDEPRFERLIERAIEQIEDEDKRAKQLEKLRRHQRKRAEVGLY